MPGRPIGVNGGFETGDLTGWIASSVVGRVPSFIGGQFGNYAARLAAAGFLEQNVATTAGQHYTLSFYRGRRRRSRQHLVHAYLGWRADSSRSPTSRSGFTNTPSTWSATRWIRPRSCSSTSPDDGTGMLVDQVSVDADAGSGDRDDRAEASPSPTSKPPIPTPRALCRRPAATSARSSLDPVSEASGSGSVAWHYSVDNADIQFLAQGQTLVQTYTVLVTDDHGGTAAQDVTIAINGANDAPTAVGENIITNVGPDGLVGVYAWMLGANDTDPDTIDHVFANNVVSSSGGDAGTFGSGVLFLDDSTLGGSFNYTSSDGIATSGNQATATVINNATSTIALVGTGGDDIIIATNGTETLDGGGGNDILVGNSGSHVMTGGTGNDSFAFLQTSDGPGIITDFNNLTETDYIAISASGFGGGLTAGMDVSAVFETSGDDQFSGSGAVFHFDSANQTLYFSADGTQASAITVATVQAGVTLNAHDLLIV